MALGRFFGGLALPGMKPAPRPVERLPLPAQLRVPLLQHAGAEAEACVAVGERVARFQRIGRVPADARGADVHAPAAGRVIGFERGTVALPGTPEAMHVLIEVEGASLGADGAAAAAAADVRLQPLDPVETPIERLRERIAEAGIVGLGGAGFPAAEKLSVGRRLLILNGAECEPVLACDEALLREHAAEVLAGGRLLARLCGATRIVLAIGRRMVPALPAVREALADDGQPSPGDTESDAGRAVELVLSPDRYPVGGERQLIQAITGEEVPEGGLPRDLGVLVHNVGTAFAAWRAVVEGEPLVSRFVTVGGDGLDAAATFEVAIGTPAGALGAALGGWRDDATVLRAGGPMMGVALPDDGVAVGKTTIAITAWRARPWAAPETAATSMPCIRCGDCAGVCPSGLQPQLLHARLAAKDVDGAEALGLGACIECGACDAACPSAIPLTRGFVDAHADARRARQQRLQADAARQRFERRIERLQREADETAQSQATRVKRVSGAAAAALAKARAKRDDEGKGR